MGGGEWFSLCEEEMKRSRRNGGRRGYGKEVYKEEEEERRVSIGWER